ncbi:MAG: hypothetical protein P8M58_06220, partial [Candidatus Marinimicrobia bacterium]|nr:hypothetical protein [Candidatus Neomarinimicrobiota bacterium]
MFRLTFILLFITNKTGNYNDLFYALWIGLRFDMRLACFILIPIVIAFLIPIYNPLNQSFFRLLAKIYLKMSILIIILLYGFDLGNYSYLDQRIDISSLKLLENPLIAFGMAWESYPMVIILFILFIVVYFVWSNIDKTFTILTNRPKVF